MNIKTKNTLIRGLIVAIIAIIIEILNYNLFPAFTRGSTSFYEIVYSLIRLTGFGFYFFSMSILAQSLIPLIQKDDLHEDIWGWIGAVAGGILALVLFYLFLTIVMVVND